MSTPVVDQAPSASGLVSVIVPVFRVEEFLDECVRSVVAQTHEALDIILINDGSPDRSGEICDMWASRDSRIRVLHKPNGGLSSARNAGIDMAAGRFITFVDSDDVVASDMIECLYAASIRYDADVVVCDYIDFTDEAPAFSRDGEVVVGSGKDVLPRLVSGRPNWAACDKLFRSKIFHGGLRFTEGVLYEDVDFTPKALVRARTAVWTSWPLYGYRQRPDSIIGRTSVRVSADLPVVLRSAIGTIREHYEVGDERESLVTACLLHASKKLEWMNPRDRSLDDFRREYRTLVRDAWPDVAKSHVLSPSYKAALALSMASPRAFSYSVGHARRLKGSVLGPLVRRKARTAPHAGDEEVPNDPTRPSNS